MKLEFHPEAEMELIEEAAYYELQVPGLGERFEAEVRRAADLLLKHPEIGPPADPHLRKFVLKKRIFAPPLFNSFFQDQTMCRLTAREKMRMSRSTIALGAWLIAALVAGGAIRAALAQTPATASGQAYPSGPLRIISPYPPGGGTDILARTIGQKLNERLGQPVVVENRAGANGTVGAAYVAKAAADGHTMLIVPAGYAANPALYKSLPYDQARDLAPVSHLASGPLVLVVHPSLPAKSVKELIALAKSRPGEINVGSAGNGSLPHLSLELFNSTSGVRMTHIPYKGSGAAIIDVMSGQVPVYFMNVLQSLPLIKSGKLRALGVTSPQRSAIAPDLPAIAEAGLKEFDMTNWYGLLVPAATPREVINKLQQEVARVLNLPELKERLAGEGMTVVASTPEQFIEFLNRETAKYNRIIQAAGIKGT